MTTTTTESATLPRSDRIGMYLNIGLGAIAIGITIWQVIVRLIEVFPGRDIPVQVPLFDQTASLPIGPDGAPIDVAVDQATILVSDPAAATLFALYAHPIVFGAAIVATIALLSLFCWRLARGRAFERSTTRIVMATLGVVAVGWLTTSILKQMSINGALAAVSDRTYETSTMTFDILPVLGILGLGVVALALQIGERLKRDTEGLV